MSVVEIRHSGEIVVVKSPKGTVVARAPSYTIGVTSGLIAGGLPYEESYEVTPTTGEQVLKTRLKTMANDITVHAIPYHETSNESGGITCSIAS